MPEQRRCAPGSGLRDYVSVTGITGERTELPADLVDADLVDNVGWLREQTALPICIGFGVSKPEHVKLLSPVADGLIVGSAVVRRMATERSREEMLEDVGALVDELVAAMSDSSV